MKIVRNPYARAVSSYAFVHKFAVETRRAMLVPVSRGSHHEELYKRYLDADLSFREWLALLSLVSAGDFQPKGARNHFLPQYVLSLAFHTSLDACSLFLSRRCVEAERAAWVAGPDLVLEGVLSPLCTWRTPLP